MVYLPIQILSDRRGAGAPWSNCKGVLVISKEGLLRACSRVREKDKTPKTYLVLSTKSSLVDLYLRSLHATLSHPGIAAMMAILTEEHIIPHLRNRLKAISRSCVFCQRAYARTTHQKMGLLPLARTDPAPPFDRTGIDFAGPFFIHRGNPRWPTRLKVYPEYFIRTDKIPNKSWTLKQSCLYIPCTHLATHSPAYI